MKRRDFIVGSASSAGILLLDGAKAATPCWPALDDSTAPPPCPIANAEADWQARISDPGVVWYHDFRTEAEVNAFRWAGGTGNDPGDLGRPNTCLYNESDGITGGCLEIFRPAGNREGAVWWRPYSALDTGTGKPENDPAANGTLPVRPWAPTQGGGQIGDFSPGYYGNATYHSAHPGRFDGTDYFFQCRVKMDPRRSGQRDGGKLFYFTRCDRSLTSQEIVTRSGEDGNVPGGGHNYFSVQRSGGTGLVDDDPGPQNQVNGELGLCDWPNTLGGCWEWSGGWDTLLYHVVPGLHNNGDTIFEVWAAHPGETTYTKIWDQANVDLPFDVIEGHGALICSAYQNGRDFATDFYHRYCQMIFSRNFIPCPLI